MRIVIDMQGAQAESRFRGIGRYTMALTHALLRNRKSHKIILAVNGAFPDSIDKIRLAFKDVLPETDIRVWHPLTPASCIADENTERRRASELVREAFLAFLAPDVVLLTSLFEGLVDDSVTNIGGSVYSFLTVSMLYDLIPFINQNPYLENPNVKSWYLEKIDHLKKADLWFAISESSRQEGIKHLDLSQIRCINISADADQQFRVLEKINVELKLTKKKYGLEHGFVMYAGGIDFRKNIEGLIRAYSLLPIQLRKQYQLAIVCSVPDDSRSKLLVLAKKRGLRDGELIFTGFVPEADLIRLYNCCSLFVFPSYHEGFGLPVLEAMRCGAPVIASNISSLPEVVGMSEAMFDPHSDVDIALLMERGLMDEKFRKGLFENSKVQSAKFSWDRTSQCAIAAIEQAHAERIKQRLSISEEMPRLKLAYVSPLPPERSGISDYSAELLPALAEHYQIDVIVDQKRISDVWVKENCSVRTIDWFMENSQSYDRVLFHFGNSSFHKHMFAMLRSTPGVVVLHDFYLSGIAHYMQATGYEPDFFTNALYQSHGYTALHDMAQSKDIAEVIWKYPASRIVFENSIGTIVHSPNSIRLKNSWYGLGESELKVVPLVRDPVKIVESGKVRKSLGYEENDFVVCSFGLLGPSKLNHRLLLAWLSSGLAQDKNCYLIFVGQNHDGNYGAELLSLIRRSPCADRIHITGWASSDTFKEYLTAANVGVQLRSLSRGETSAAVLDCMNYGLPTIVNANGSMADLDRTAVVMISDEFDNAELVYALEKLWRDKAKRRKLGDNARKIIHENHNPVRCAKSYAEIIEDFYQTNSPVLFKLYPRLANIVEGVIDDGDLKKLANNLALSFSSKSRPKQLLVDVSELVQGDANTGIQRVVRNVLKELLTNPPVAYHVEPVYATLDQGYRYARRFTSEFMSFPANGLSDDPIDYAPEDILFVLDLQPQVQVAQRGFYRHIRRQGAKVFFLVYDLLCVQMPQYFVPGAREGHTPWLEVVAEADGAICTSSAVAEEFKLWLEKYKPSSLCSVKTEWFHLGADIDKTQLSNVLSCGAQTILSQIIACPSFLMVGTLEPRKGHEQVLNSIELLWREGIDVNLIIVGKQGWLVSLLVERLKCHPELNKRLFWLDGISDEYLEKIYSSSTCLIAASYGEGFGLPLIEAAQHKLPIIARDIPVFREVAGAHAYYFDTESVDGLAISIREWLDLYRNNNQPKSNEMPWLTWKESTKNLMNILLDACSPS